MNFKPKYYIDKMAGYDRYEKSLIYRARLDDGNGGCLFCSRGEKKIKHKKICDARNEIDSETSKVIHKKRYVCTRKPNHQGYHVACGALLHAFFIWK